MSIELNVEKLNNELKNIVDKHKIMHQITVLAATKYVGINEIRELLKSGINNIGENKVQDFLTKYESLANEEIIWHFIGHLQTNKVSKIINKIDYLHSLDRENLAVAINKYAINPVNCYVEVNCSNEESKHGLKPEEVINFIHSLASFKKIKVVGLMTMAPNIEDQMLIRKSFALLRKIQQDVINLKLEYAPCTQLSMGMSNDFLLAVLEGTTIIRIGSRLFS